jgi:hypothetical protein
VMEESTEPIDEVAEHISFPQLHPG